MRPDENNRTYAPGGSEEEKLLKNMGLVHSIASRFPYSGVEYEDLVQIGSLGLLKAIRNFDESKGFAFSTYAVPVITGEIKRFLRDDGSIKVSRAVRSDFIKIRACTEKLRNSLGRDPTVGELSENTGLTLEEVVEALDSASRELVPEDRKLITLRYFCAKTQQQTADILGMSQVQVSRREKKILERLKEYV